MQHRKRARLVKMMCAPMSDALEYAYQKGEPRSEFLSIKFIVCVLQSNCHLPFNYSVVINKSVLLEFKHF